MWLSSQDGINRYNGIESFHFTDSFFYENCKPLKQIFGIVEDVNVDIWMGFRQVLYKYQQERNKFKKIDMMPNNQVSGKIVMPFAVFGNEYGHQLFYCKTIKLKKSTTSYR
jgi:ligand-binding sensor domain-containing protein